MKQSAQKTIIAESITTGLQSPVQLVHRLAGLDAWGNHVNEAYGVIFPPHKNMPQSGTWFKDKEAAENKYNTVTA